MEIPGGAAAQQQQQKAKEQEEARQAILSRILDASARERLSRIALVRGSQARQVEDMLIRAAQMGQITEQVDEKRIVALLEQITESAPTSKITVCYFFVVVSLSYHLF